MHRILLILPKQKVTSFSFRQETFNMESLTFTRVALKGLVNTIFVVITKFLSLLYYLHLFSTERGALMHTRVMRFLLYFPACANISLSPRWAVGRSLKDSKKGMNCAYKCSYKKRIQLRKWEWMNHTNSTYDCLRWVAEEGYLETWGELIDNRGNREKHT